MTGFTEKIAIMGLMMLGFVVGCSEMEFSADKNFKACHSSGLNCVLISPGVERFDYDVKTNSGIVDILIVDDNSGSMSTEQRHMAERFPTFISSLGDLDYHIAITTTDVSASPNNGPKAANGFGALQDGKFIQFGNGSAVLTRDTPNKETLFANTVKRPETISCEQNDFQSAYCPSPDERGIYAAYLAVERKDASFFRQGAHFALVILADEDERSTRNNQTVVSQYPTEEKDIPDNLVKAVKQHLGGQKTFSAHSVIVKPGDTACLNAQATTFPSGRRVTGFEGIFYARLSTLTGGHIGSICATDYGTELGKIGYNIKDHLNSVQLVCSPIDKKVDVLLTPKPPGVSTTFDASTNTVKFSQPIPPNTNIHLTYDCIKAI
ncbi:MAG: hypothetical protein A4S09_16540 [Proteobacteria bacterium SG_bin7]|nr:MAG: hypothetical protein A4S09_16540 [Proteobacteria bacterium SG_bin7]